MYGLPNFSNSFIQLRNTCLIRDRSLSVWRSRLFALLLPSYSEPLYNRMAFWTNSMNVPRVRLNLTDTGASSFLTFEKGASIFEDTRLAFDISRMVFIYVWHEPTDVKAIKSLRWVETGLLNLFSWKKCFYFDFSSYAHEFLSSKALSCKSAITVISPPKKYGILNYRYDRINFQALVLSLTLFFSGNSLMHWRVLLQTWLFHRFFRLSSLISTVLNTEVLGFYTKWIDKTESCINVEH